LVEQFCFETGLLNDVLVDAVCGDQPEDHYWLALADAVRERWPAVQYWG
jgi:hypothetical protein